MITLIDKGPADKPFDKPVEVRMESIDANHAVAVDPARYSTVGRDVTLRKTGSLEDRVLAIENWIADFDTEDDIERAPEPVKPTEPSSIALDFHPDTQFAELPDKPPTAPYPPAPPKRDFE